MLKSTDLSCILDYETFSEADLKKTGAYEYARHPSTEILCVAFRVGKFEDLAKIKTLIWSPHLEETQKAFPVLLSALRHPGMQYVAHNAMFEFLITRFVFGPKYMASKPELQRIPFERWHCTAAHSRAQGLPGKLEHVGQALKLSHQKDMAGHRLMLRMSKPKKPTKKDPSTRVLDLKSLKRLAAYCEADLKAEVDLLTHLKPMTPKERKFWCMDQETNLRGFGVDRKLVKSALKLIAKETPKLDARTRELTDGEISSTRQNAALLEYLQRHGVKIKNLQAQTISDLLAKGKIDSVERELLEIRQRGSRSSTKKYVAFELRSRSDGRARDNTTFFGAHTGRQSGNGLQPQNLFKSLFSKDDLAVGVDLIRAQDETAIEALFDRPMDLYASALRSCIVPAAGHVLDVGDFATIELRVLFWLAGHAKGIEALARGDDLYVEMAGDVYEIDVKEILQGRARGDKRYVFMRELGKQCVLGSGFGLGLNGESFVRTCKKYGMIIDVSLAQKAIRAYRERHRPIPAFWGNLERAAVMALANPNKVYRIGYLRWCYQAPYLWCQLPSGRKFHYYRASVRMKQTLYGPKATIFFWGMNSKTKKFEETSTWGGTLTENAVQAIARDIMYEAMYRLETKTPSKPVLAVHDEIVAERLECEGSLEEFLNTMAEVPEWAKGLPLKVEGWSERRYRK